MAVHLKTLECKLDIDQIWKSLKSLQKTGAWELKEHIISPLSTTIPNHWDVKGCCLCVPLRTCLLSCCRSIRIWFCGSTTSVVSWQIHVRWICWCTSWTTILNPQYVLYVTKKRTRMSYCYSQRGLVNDRLHFTILMLSVSSDWINEAGKSGHSSSGELSLLLNCTSFSESPYLCKIPLLNLAAKMNPSTSMYLTVSRYSNLEHFEETLLWCTPPVRGSKTLHSGEVLRYVTHKTTSIPKRNTYLKKWQSMGRMGWVNICKLQIGALKKPLQISEATIHRLSFRGLWGWLPAYVRVTAFDRFTLGHLVTKFPSWEYIHNFHCHFCNVSETLYRFPLHKQSPNQTKDENPQKRVSSNVSFNFPSPPGRLLSPSLGGGRTPKASIPGGAWWRSVPTPQHVRSFPFPKI